MRGLMWLVMVVVALLVCLVADVARAANPEIIEPQYLGSSQNPVQAAVISSATVTTGTLTGGLVPGGVFVATFTTEALTSPATTIDVSDTSWVKLTSDAAATGVTLTGGRTGQIVWIGFSGSNSARFDDNGTVLALGANKTLSAGDWLVLGTLDGTNWGMVADGSGN